MLDNNMEYMLETCFNNCLFGVLLLDNNGKYIYMNNMAKDLLSYSKNNSFTEHNNTFPWVEYIIKCDNSYPVSKDLDLIIVNDKRKVVSWEICFFGNSSKMSTELKYLVLLRDREEYSQLIQMIIETEVRTHHLILIKALANKLHNPLCVANGFIDLLDRQDIGEIYNKYVKEIKKHMTKINLEFDKFIMFNDGVNFEVQNIDLQDLVEEVVLFYSKEVENSDVHIEYEFKDDNCRIVANPQYLYIILKSIVENALEAATHRNMQMGEEGKVKISLKNTGYSAIISVEDSGWGFPNNIKNSIFEPFFTTKAEKVGLGLVVVNKILELYNGVIKIDTSQLGGGLVEVEIPLKRTKKSNEIDILLILEREARCYCIERILKMDGFRVKILESIKEIEKVDLLPNLIITDRKSLKKEGEKLLNKIWPKAKIIMLNDIKFYSDYIGDQNKQSWVKNYLLLKDIKGLYNNIN
ncbi:MAG: ATP-binding protein [Eubacteriales bacterium]